MGLEGIVWSEKPISEDDPLYDSVYKTFLKRQTYRRWRTDFLVVLCTVIVQEVTIGRNWVKGIWDLSVLFLSILGDSIILKANRQTKKLKTFNSRERDNRLNLVVK